MDLTKQTKNIQKAIFGLLRSDADARPRSKTLKRQAIRTRLASAAHRPAPPPNADHDTPRLRERQSGGVVNPPQRSVRDEARTRLASEYSRAQTLLAPFQMSRDAAQPPTGATCRTHASPRSARTTRRLVAGYPRPSAVTHARRRIISSPSTSSIYRPSAPRPRPCTPAQTGHERRGTHVQVRGKQRARTPRCKGTGCASISPRKTRFDTPDAYAREAQSYSGIPDTARIQGSRASGGRVWYVRRRDAGTQSPRRRRSEFGEGESPQAPPPRAYPLGLARARGGCGEAKEHVSCTVRAVPLSAGDETRYVHARGDGAQGGDAETNCRARRTSGEENDVEQSKMRRRPRDGQRKGRMCACGDSRHAQAGAHDTIAKTAGSTGGNEHIGIQTVRDGDSRAGHRGRADVELWMRRVCTRRTSAMRAGCATRRSSAENVCVGAVAAGIDGQLRETAWDEGMDENGAGRGGIVEARTRTERGMEGERERRLRTWGKGGNDPSKAWEREKEDCVDDGGANRGQNLVLAQWALERDRRVSRLGACGEQRSFAGRVLLLVPYYDDALPASTSTDSQSEFADLPFLVDGLQSTAESPACETVPLLAYISHLATTFTTLAAHTPSSASLRTFGNFYGQTRIFFRGSIGIRARRGNPEPGLPGVARMVCRESSNSPRTHRMRMVRGRKGGTADGMTDDREAGTGAAMAGRNSHGLSQCHVGAAKRPGGQDECGTEYKPVRWRAGGQLLHRTAWVGYKHSWTRRTRWTGYSQCPRWFRKATLGCYQVTSGKTRRKRAEYKPARWRRRWASNSLAARVGESIDGRDILRALEHGRARTHSPLREGEC
ncbi:hypothetical protein DFH06DRAFT_1299575 [Mycena polygramma]|nr:hypothetical protein DFH06DRAFT_1299575 [Mycena polygramma]